jgi:hypothetical protein
LVFGGDAYLKNSTVSGNYSSSVFGGVYAADSDGSHTLRIVDSTISGNSAEQSTGGVGSYRMAYTKLHNSTITDNFAPYCGGMYVYYGVTDLKSSIIGANSSTHSTNYFGLPTAADFDIFYNNATVDGDHNLVMTSNMTMPPDTITDDPLLLPLADNGGATLTHALLPESPAIDTGSNPSGLETDQRGGSYVRSVGAAPDIGAFELQAAPDAIFADGFD